MPYIRTVPVDLYKLGNVVEKEVVKKTLYEKLVKTFWLFRLLIPVI